MPEWVPLSVKNAIATSIPPFELDERGRRKGETSTRMVIMQACIEFTLSWSEMIGWVQLRFTVLSWMIVFA